MWNLYKPHEPDTRPKLGPPAPAKQEMWCLTCEVRQVLEPHIPCWLCGGWMSCDKPVAWNNFGAIAPAQR